MNLFFAGILFKKKRGFICFKINKKDVKNSWVQKKNLYIKRNKSIRQGQNRRDLLTFS